MGAALVDQLDGPAFSVANFDCDEAVSVRLEGHLVASWEIVTAVPGASPGVLAADTLPARGGTGRCLPFPSNYFRVGV
jgi:hypothetical protein